MPDEDIALLIDAAREAGRLALELAGKGVKSWDKSPGNPVTEADLALDRMLAGRLRAARPNYGWVSEESSDERSRRGARRSFFVDPIDGTRDFLRGRSGFAVSLAVVEGTEPVAGVLFAPAREELYVARRGDGATLNGRRIGVAAARSLKGARLPVDPSAFNARFWAEPWEAVAVEKPNAIALRIAKVASGEADALFDGRPARDVDVAAGALILAEAGGRITDHLGNAPDFSKADAGLRSIVAATPAIHEPLRLRLADALQRYAAHRARESGR